MKMLMLFSCAVQRNSALLVLLLATTGLAIFAQMPAAPQITSGNSVTFTGGVPGTFTITSPGSPAIIETGALPGGVFFVDNGDGTATLAGTPALGFARSYPLTIAAFNGIQPDAQQNFLLTISATAMNG